MVTAPQADLQTGSGAAQRHDEVDTAAANVIPDPEPYNRSSREKPCKGILIDGQVPVLAPYDEDVEVDQGELKYVVRVTRDRRPFVNKFSTDLSISGMVVMAIASACLAAWSRTSSHWKVGIIRLRPEALGKPERVVLRRKVTKDDAHMLQSAWVGSLRAGIPPDPAM